jgi:hypothetical protein
MTIGKYFDMCNEAHVRFEPEKYFNEEGEELEIERRQFNVTEKPPVHHSARKTSLSPSGEGRL